MATGASTGKINVVTAEGSTDRVQYKQYSIYRELRLGSGSFGTVYMGFDHDKQRLIAAKQMLFSNVEFSKTEVDVLLRLTEHDHVVRFFDSFSHDGKRFIVMQFCDGPCLDGHMELQDPPVASRMALIFQLIQTIQFMHFSQPPTAHRDLKPANIMVINGGHLKICDFGLARPVMNSTQNVSTVAGTYKYLSPEIYQGKKYNPFKADVFSAGLVMLGVITFIVGETFGHVFHTGKLVQPYANQITSRSRASTPSVG
jgi:serine/threonine protein kinase